MRVLIPTQLHSYTGRVPEVEASGNSLDEVLDDLERQYPGLRFRVIDEQDRIREHIRIFVRGELATDIHRPIVPTDEVQIVGALSGG